MAILSRFTSLLRLAHIRLRKKYHNLFLGISISLILIFLAPAIFPDRALEVLFSEDISEYSKNLNDPLFNCSSYTTHFTPLVIVGLRCQKRKEGDKSVEYPVIWDRTIDYETLLIAIMVVLFVRMTIQLLSRSRSAGTSQQQAKASFEMPHADITVENALLIEAKNTWLITDRFYANSIYLLISGVSTAVGSAVFFYFSIRSVPLETKEDIRPYLLSIIRPVGMLIFIEAIAWFLLRQYRSAIEDYKAFHRIYLRRSNYFIARRAFSEILSFEKSRRIAQELLSEDLSGRLSNGQTTEAIEAMKMDENNPVFKVLTDALARATGKAKEESAEKPGEKSAAKESKKE